MAQILNKICPTCKSIRKELQNNISYVLLLPNITIVNFKDIPRNYMISYMCIFLVVWVGLNGLNLYFFQLLSASIDNSSVFLQDAQLLFETKRSNGCKYCSVS